MTKGSITCKVQIVTKAYPCTQRCICAFWDDQFVLSLLAALKEDLLNKKLSYLKAGWNNINDIYESHIWLW